MLVLHGTWLNDTFYIWGEHYRPEVQRRGRRPEARPDRALKHPYAASAEVLQRSLEKIAGHPLPAAQQGRLHILLPSDAHTPAPSKELGHAPGGPVQPDRLGLWWVPALSWTPEDALDVLLAIPLHLIGPRPGILLGTDLRYWAHVAYFLLNIIAGQHYVPAVEQEGNHLKSQWRPWLDGGTLLQQFSALTEAMPPVCRAARPARGTWSEPSAGDLLTQVLTIWLDRVLRSWTEALQAELADRPYTPVVQWLRSLVAPSPAFQVYEEERLIFLQHIRAWMEVLRSASLGNVRFCLRLDPPEGERNEPWVLRYFLQSREDPSLLIPAEHVWRSRSLKILDRYVQAPQEALLRGLGVAARLFPPLERSLQEAQPTQCLLSLEEAYTFLKQTAPVLEQSGIGVLLPSWWVKRQRRLSARAVLSSPEQVESSGVLGMERLVQFDWQLALGDQVLSPEEFRALVDLKTPLVKIRGQWVEVQPEQIEQVLQFWERRQSRQTLTWSEALRVALAPESVEVNGIPVSQIQVTGALRRLLRDLESAQFQLIPQPQSFQGQLRPYQVRGFSWMAFLRRWGLGACLADDMGLGKTPQTIALFLHVREQGQTRRPSLVVCPTSVVVNWKRELEHFAPSLRVMIHHGPQRRRGEEFVQAVEDYDVVITSYAVMQRDIEFLQRVQWANVVLDEAQNIKNPQTKTARAARKLQAEFRIALTGTPIENRLMELWSIFAFLNPGYLGSQRAFRREFVLPIERWRSEEHTRRLRRLVGPFILRRLKTDPEIVRDLPSKLEMKVYVPLTEEQVTLYQAVVESALSHIERASGMERRGLVLSTLTKLKQICNHPAQFLGEEPGVARLAGRSGKLSRLADMLQVILEEGDKALVFTQFRQMGALLERYLSEVLGVEVLFLHGGIPQRARQRLIDAFQSPSGPPIFLLSLRAGGTGLNLTAATHVFHFDRWWNPAVEDQATDRAYRIGQTRTVEVHKFISVGTVEEHIDELMERKKDLAQRVVAAGEEWITELSTEELRELFRLRAEMVM